MHVRARTLIIFAICIGAVILYLQWPQGEPTAVADVAQCPAILDVSHRPLGERHFSGATERVQERDFDDVFLYDLDKKFKVGVREQWGASIIFWGEAGNQPGENPTNTLDNSQLGRGLSLVFHDDRREGWMPHQGGNKCGIGSGIEGFEAEPDPVFTALPLLALCTDQSISPKRSPIRLQETLRFVKSRVLELEYLITNLSGEDFIAKSGELNEIPSLFASSGKAGAANLSVLKNAQGKILNGEGRIPAAGEAEVSEISAPGGWAAFQTPNSDYGVGLYWENRNSRLRTIAGNWLGSNFGFALPARNSVRARFYLLLGGYDQIKSLASELDTDLPPFGRIDFNQIQDDARTVRLRGWALDNKDVATLELWVDGKKVSDLNFNSQRDDICATYPGYSMCENKKLRVGFEATYPRPQGSGCERSVEVRAVDSDGNHRVIARKSVSPVVY